MGNGPWLRSLKSQGVGSRRSRRPRKVGERSRMRCGVSRLQSSGQQIHRQLDEITQEVTLGAVERHWNATSGIFQGSF